MVDNVVGYPVLTFFINGQKIYLKGGNWGMSEYLLRCQGKEYETKIRLHKEMNYNMIRLWTGCVTDDEFYDYCDKYGIMVWNDFWLYVAYNDVAQPEAFKANALIKSDVLETILLLLFGVEQMKRIRHLIWIITCVK